MNKSQFDATAAYGEITREEDAVRMLINTSVEEGVRGLKNQSDITILREALRRELESASPRSSIVKPLRRRIKKLKEESAIEVEIIEIKDTLEDCAAGITTASDRIEKEYARYDRITKYDRVLIGLWLMKAKHLHLRPTVGRRDEATGQLTSVSGFQDWLKSDAPHIKQSTAYNYINAATNAGLTIESVEKDVAALKKAGALDTTPIKQLYASPNAEIEEQEVEEDTEQPTPKFSLIRDTLTGTRKECQMLLDLKDDMTPEAHETACARLVRTLEELTGSKWGPCPDDQAATYTEHPEAYELGS